MTDYKEEILFASWKYYCWIPLVLVLIPFRWSGLQKFAKQLVGTTSLVPLCLETKGGLALVVSVRTCPSSLAASGSWPGPPQTPESGAAR